MGLFSFSLVIIIPVLIAQWIGIIGIGKWQRGGPWWVMAAGTGLSTLSLLLMVGLMVMAMGVTSGTSRFAEPLMFVLGMGGLSTLGSLIFSIGFAVHGLRNARIRDRVTELEALSAAQAQELSRLRAT